MKKYISLVRPAVALAILVAGYFSWTKYYSPAPSIAQLTEQTRPAVNMLSDLVIPETDLPPEGTRSLFDHLIAQNDVLPFPFSKIITMLEELSPDGTRPLTVLIPDGRSLLKAEAKSVHPRILVATDFQGANTPVGLGLNAQGQLFLGYVEDANEIEVLSYNEGAGRFEFQLIKDYCENCVPRIVYARRAICLTCHQGAAPIFSQRPWNETNAHVAIADSIRQSRGGSEPYWGVALKQPLTAPERIDELTDVGNFYIITQRLWLDGCGDQGNECRRSMLSLALRYANNPGNFDPAGPEADRLRQLQEASFPEEGIDVAESDLRNRDPMVENQGFQDWLNNLFSFKGDSDTHTEDEATLSSFDKLPPLDRALDPLTLRAPKKILNSTDIDGVYGVARLFTDSDIATLGKHYNYDVELLLDNVAALDNSVFSPRPISRVKMMEALLGQKPQYCCLDTAEMSPPQASGVPPLVIDNHPMLQNFERYCFTCHRGNPAKRLDFMAGENAQVVLESIEAKVEIRETLDWERYEGTETASKMMPPRDSVQYEKLKAAGDTARQQMRDTVPGLFDF